MKRKTTNEVRSNGGMEIITKRPANMSFDKYKTHMKKQTSWLKNRLSSGVLVYRSWIAIRSDNGDTMVDAIKKFPPFVGEVKKLEPLADI